MENITVENANELLSKAKISDTNYRQQAAAWVIVNQFCYQSGLYHKRDEDHLSGIQKVIKYLSETQSENKALQDQNKLLNSQVIKDFIAQNKITELESEIKALREDNLRLQNRVSSLENICEMDRKTEYQYNQLYKEKEALREEIEILKDQILEQGELDGN